MIREFRTAHQLVAELMGKGILTVGFPDSSHIQPGSELSDSVMTDRKKLKELIYSCNEGVVIPQADSTSLHSDTDNSRPILLQIDQGYQSIDSFCCCSVL